MQKRFLTLTIGLMVASLLGCAKPNMQIFSSWDKRADSSHKGKVVLTTGYLTIIHEPSERELAAFPEVRARIEALGFQVVDSMSNADLILNFHIYENRSFYAAGGLWSAAQWVLSPSVSGDGNLHWWRGKSAGGEIVKDSSGYDLLALRLSRIEQSGSLPTELWHSAIRTRSEYFENDLDEIIELAIAQYGKETSESLVYRPKKRPNTIANK